jgi:hypothetical protein
MWNPDFPGTGDLVTAAIWPDLIKCTAPASYCQFPKGVSLGEFSNWHFNDKPFVPRLPPPLPAAHKRKHTQHPRAERRLHGDRSIRRQRLGVASCVLRLASCVLRLAVAHR